MSRNGLWGALAAAGMKSMFAADAPTHSLPQRDGEDITTQKKESSTGGTAAKKFARG